MNTVCELGLLTLLVIGFPILGRSQTNETKVIDKFIAQQAAKYKGEEYPDARKVISGDLNHDGIPDTAVLYTIEGQNGSNNYIQYLAVFLESKKVLATTEGAPAIKQPVGLVFAARTAVGGKNRRDVELVSITNGLINLNTTEYGPKDPSCCPTIKGTAKFELIGGQLKEIRKPSTANSRTP